MTKTSLIAVLACGAVLFHPAAARCALSLSRSGDGLRFEMLEEDLRAIERSMRKAAGMERTGNQHQLMRWMKEKDRRVDDVQEILWRYFLVQRIQPVEPGRKTEFAKYGEELRLVHRMLFLSARCEEGLELSHVEKLRALLSELRALFAGTPPGKR